MTMIKKLIKREEEAPLPVVTQDEMLQDRINMQSSIDKMDYAIQKAAKKKTLREMTGPGAQVRDILGEVGRALDGLGDMGLSDTKIEGKPKYIKNIDELATFK